MTGYEGRTSRLFLPHQNVWPFIAQAASHFSYLSPATHSPSAFIFFSSARRSFLPIFGAGAAFCIVEPFPWILSFHQRLCFPFESNQIDLRRDKATASEAFMMTVAGTHFLFPALLYCYGDQGRGSTVQPEKHLARSSLRSAALYQYMCLCTPV